MKSEWPKVPLSQVAEVQTGPFGSLLHNKDYVATGTPIVTVEHLGNRFFTTQNLPCVSDADRCRLSKYSLKTGDIVFSRVGSVDRCSYVNETSSGWLFSGRCLRVRSTNILPEFLYYFFCQSYVKEYIKSIAVGATMPSINTKLLNEVDVVLPPLPIQQKIASILSALDDKIETNNAICRNLEEQAMALYKSWFIDFEPFKNSGDTYSKTIAVPLGWNVGTVNDVVEFHDFRRVPLSKAQREKMKKNYPYYGATELMDYVEDFLFDGVFLLLGEDGTVQDDFGYPILQYVWGKFWVNNHAHVLTGKSKWTTEILYLLFSHLKISSIVTGAVQPKISQNRLKTLPVVIPPNQVLEQFNSLISPLFASRRELNTENRKLTSMRNSLLPKLMSGELAVEGIN